MIAISSLRQGRLFFLAGGFVVFAQAPMYAVPKLNSTEKPAS
jgi:hypothetical protein